MPFITEELYQRLPRMSDKDPPSICVATYPDTEECPWRNLEIEAEVDFVQKIIHLVRSARSDYNLPNKTKTEELVCGFSDDETSASLKKYQSALSTLSYCSKMEVSTSPPKGCVILTVSDKCEVHLLLKGLIEPAKEMLKLQKKQDQLQQQLNKLKQAMSAPDYEVKVPQEVRQTNSEKLNQTEGELLRLESAMTTLKSME
ncbi:hypothetical protein L9F63_027981 [Diploptera punctata]|uniref:valine--tRNA ligase n=1 Tax=Diploptera punctata TaxID=6984 RepID=A0AAD7ZYG3_DIPPU|nr:hypothetical protein L9F63_027981 [Diploptera punctata]